MGKKDLEQVQRRDILVAVIHIVSSSNWAPESKVWKE
jgi:hypothetical protein